MTDQTVGGQGSAGSNLLTWIALALGAVALVAALYAMFAGPGVQVPAPAAETRQMALSSDLLNESNRYHPSALVAYAGDTLAFNVTNRGEIPHGFRIETLGIEVIIEPGESTEQMATNVAAGVYRYYCHLHPGHIGGQLIVFGR
jgi:plastocyanin